MGDHNQQNRRGNRPESNPAHAWNTGAPQNEPSPQSGTAPPSSGQRGPGRGQQSETPPDPRFSGMSDNESRDRGDEGGQAGTTGRYAGGGQG